MIGVILAGGSGTRFWPKSRELSPKQLLRIGSTKTMIQETIFRLLPLIPVNKIFVVTNESHAFEICRQLEEFQLPPANILAEPTGKNTAPALAFISKILEKHYHNEILSVFPSDHVVQDLVPFHEALKKAENAAEQNYLVTIGIQPTRPESGYGYIKQANALPVAPGVFRVEQFIEKPNLETAKVFLNDASYLWNCGVFVWKVSVFLAEMQKQMPKIMNTLETIAEHTQTNNGRYGYKKLDKSGCQRYESLTSESVDFGVMEKSNNVAVVPADVGWNDVGSWRTIEDIAIKDDAGNVTSENTILIDSTGSIIQGEGRLIALVGAKDLIVIDTPDALLVCDKNRAQDVKKVVEKIKAEGRPEVKIHTQVQKPWGSYTVLEQSKNQLVKRLEILPGEKLSLQMHNHREEQWMVISGQAEVVCDDKNLILNKNDAIFIPKGAKHRLGNPGVEPLTLIEVQLGEKIDEKDIIRFRDIYGRT